MACLLRQRRGLAVLLELGGPTLVRLGARRRRPRLFLWLLAMRTRRRSAEAGEAELNLLAMVPAVDARRLRSPEEGPEGSPRCLRRGRGQEALGVRLQPVPPCRQWHPRPLHPVRCSEPPAVAQV